MEKGTTIYFTKEGLDKLKKEYDHLVNFARRGIAQRIQDVREDGEVDENIEYTAALEERGRIEGRITELEELLKKAKVIARSKEVGAVSLGSTVVVEVDGEKDELTIVGSIEADPTKGLISNESPVGQALLGAKVGEVVTVASAIKTSYKILKIK